MDSFGNWALITLIVCVLALIVSGFLFAVICLIVSAEIAAVLWSPLRGWLAIPERQAEKPRRRAQVAERLDR